jgi:hypothetical protein
MRLTRHIAVHLGESCGFVEGCNLVYKAGKASDNNQGQMKSDNFEKQVNEKVIQIWQPHLPSSRAMCPPMESKLINCWPSHL